LLGVVKTIMGFIGIIVIGDIASGKIWGMNVGLLATIVIGDIANGKSWGMFVPDMGHILPICRYVPTLTEGCSA
jgi:hypothetical protein